MAEDCKDLLQYAIDELQASFSTVGDSNLHTVTDREDELKNWLSAVISYQQTCVDGFTTPQLRDAMSTGLLNATQLTDNALAIVTAISQILHDVNISSTTAASRRRLLDLHGFPVWLPAETGNCWGANRSLMRCYREWFYSQVDGVSKHRRARGTPGRGSSCTIGYVCFLQLQNGWVPRHIIRTDPSPVFPQLCHLRTVDFIFGTRAVVIQNCLIIVRKPMDNQQNTVTAQGRTQSRETTGTVIQNCRIVPEQKLEPVRFKIRTYLGRPWKTYSRTVIMESTLADFIQPQGWMPWSGDFALDTLYYREYANRGPGASTDNRVKWKGYGVITNRNEAMQFTAAQFIQANQWLTSTAVPFFLGLKN
ncbi:hypothetical protein DH2020_004313 [Rehmannia glutinosa]|uniref:Pectinesterase n=1 Tax=Rehmannia glutinosa TaxID=99300 RepID=A0ABR0XP63_REHGL